MSSSASTWRWYEIGPGADLSRRGKLRLGAGVQGRAQGCTGQGQGDAMRCLPQPGLHPGELALPRQGGLDGVGEQDDQRLRRADPEGRRRADRRLPGAELRQKALGAWDSNTGPTRSTWPNRRCATTWMIDAAQYVATNVAARSSTAVYVVREAYRVFVRRATTESSLSEHVYLSSLWQGAHHQ